MINLIRNEITKLFHKKSLRVLCILLFVWMLFIFLFEQLFGSNGYDTYLKDEYNYYKSQLDDYDLTNKDDATEYAEVKSMLDITELQMKYDDVESAENYFIINVMGDVIRELNYAKYVTKVDAEITDLQKEYDALLKKLDTYDWEFELSVQREEYIKEIENLEKLYSANEISDKEFKSAVDALNVHIKAIDYRLILGVPYSYTYNSTIIEDYETFAITYMSMNKDESSYKEYRDLINKRETEESYKVSEYKLDNDLVYEESTESLMQEIILLFSYVDTFVLIAMIIISGGIIADEFSSGTIKQLLVKPFSRNKIFVSKLIAAFIVSFLFILVYFIAYLVFICAKAGDFSLLANYVVDYNFVTGEAFKMHLLPYCAIYFLSILPQYLIIFAFVLFMGTLTTNAVGAISSGFCLYFFANLINYSVSNEIASYLPFSCWDFSCYLFGGIANNSFCTLTKSIIICVVTIVILIVGAFIIFKNKDIKNQ